MYGVQFDTISLNYYTKEDSGLPVPYLQLAQTSPAKDPEAALQALTKVLGEPAYGDSFGAALSQPFSGEEPRSYRWVLEEAGSGVDPESNGGLGYRTVVELLWKGFVNETDDSTLHPEEWIGSVRIFTERLPEVQQLG